MVLPYKRYFVYPLPVSPKSREEIVRSLKSSSHIRKKTYFEGEDTKTLDLKSKFERLTIDEDSGMIHGYSKIEVAKEGTDLDQKYSLIKDTKEAQFFIGKMPKDHAIIMADSDSLVKILSRVIGEVIYKDKFIPKRMIMTDRQIIDFCDKNLHTKKGRITGSTIQGVNTIGFWGSNVEKAVETELLQKYLTENKALKLLLHDNSWTIWISKRTGALSCVSPHDPNDFVEFIQEKILPL